MSGEHKPIITADMAKTSEIILRIGLFSVASVLGTMTNILNMVVYWKQGLKDSITVGLFAISISDFFVAFFPLISSVCFGIDNLYGKTSVDLKTVSGATAVQLRSMFYAISSTLTAFMSIERCLCVKRPLKVKVIFTRSRTIIATVVIFLFFILGWAPKFYSSPLKWRRLASRNYSYVLTVSYHPAFNSIEGYHNSVMTIFMPTLCQVVITCTAIIMVRGLRKASKFRQHATRAKIHENDARHTADSSSPADYATKASDSVVADIRDTRLVKTMVVLVTVLSIANVPYVALEYAQLFELELRPGKLYQNLFRMFFGTIILLGTINASINTFVYYCIGSRYKKIVNDMFCAVK